MASTARAWECRACGCEEQQDLKDGDYRSGMEVLRFGRVMAGEGFASENLSWGREPGPAGLRRAYTSGE